MTFTKEQKRQARKVIFAMTIHDDWEENQSTVQKVQELSKVISNDDIGTSNPLPLLEASQMTRNNYLYLLQQGYRVKDIRNRLDIGVTKFAEWLVENKASRNFVSRAELAQMVFSDEDKKLPVGNEEEA